MNKKLGIALVALCLLVCLVGCSGGDSQLAGTKWEFSVTIGSNVLSSNTLSFTKDKVTETTTVMGVSTSQTYSYTLEVDKLTYNNKTYEVEIDGDELILTTDNLEISYTRVD